MRFIFDPSDLGPVKTVGPHGHWVPIGHFAKKSAWPNGWRWGKTPYLGPERWGHVVTHGNNLFIVKKRHELINRGVEPTVVFLSGGHNRQWRQVAVPVFYQAQRRM